MRAASGAGHIRFRQQVTISALTGLLLLGIAEASLRWYDGGGLPSLRLFWQMEDGDISLRDGAEVLHRLRNGYVYPVSTGPYGIRTAGGTEPAPGPDHWIAIGDSQIFGLGVTFQETFAEVCRHEGIPVLNAGVPGYGIEDGLRRVNRLLPRFRPKGILLFVNQANDWEEFGHPVESRFKVRGGWLLRRGDADGAEGLFMASPLSRVHFFYYINQFLYHAIRNKNSPVPPPPWINAPEGQDAVTARMVEMIHAFATAHPELKVLVIFLPVDFATGEDRALKSPFAVMIQGTYPWKQHVLRDQLSKYIGDTPYLDLLPVLADRADAFLDGDYHLSPVGHKMVASAIIRKLRSHEDGK